MDFAPVDTVGGMGKKEKLDKTRSEGPSWGRSKQQLSSWHYGLMLVGVVAQVVALIITRELWEVRETGMPHLPVLGGVTQISFFWTLLATLAVVPFFPRTGVWLHFAVMLIACLFDQMRTLPQFLATWILMAGVTHGSIGVALTRWFLVSLWFWAGLHKLLSPAWHTWCSWEMAKHLGLNGDEWYYIVAFVIALTEIGVGLLAWFKPMFGAIGCIVLHCGIVVCLSPLFMNWNFSVIPWNLATAIVGAWVLFTVGRSRGDQPMAASDSERSSLSWWQTVWFQRALFAVMMILPAGFYVGWIDHGYAHVLYSGQTPTGLITRNDGSLDKIHGWGVLAVPFPSERRMFLQYFSCVAEVGEKLHVRDPRSGLKDIHLLMTVDGAQQITRSEFFAVQEGTVSGLEKDSKYSIFQLSFGGAKLLQRDENSMIYAIKFNPDLFHSDLFEELDGISNLEQIQLAGTSVNDEDLKRLANLPKLTGIGLNNTSITDQGIETLMKLPQLQLIEVQGTNVTPEAILRFYESRNLGE